ncbi:hypothetical protein RGU77_05395 [Actimicrobium sp. CCI2.3]|uniref:hypothetical protein n=1 Tax=Actimicrobium sp. CCI2.3 TaxID=3048616 RepID=UPI002AB371DC|nr:hypothetical protein [Actimicrobium sp. CCI2.3]MDY7573724.1 hypothetical protein [Actimicrobium sp. CCI2.3]
MKIASGRAVKWAAIALMVSASVPALAVSTQSSGAPEAMTFASVNEAGSFDYAVYASGGMFDYYTRHNMTDFYLPYFSDMGILHIDSGASWDYVIEEKTTCSDSVAVSCTFTTNGLMRPPMTMAWHSFSSPPTTVSKARLRSGS